MAETTHVEISAAQRNAGQKKFEELMAAEKPVETETPAAGETQEAQSDETGTDPGQNQENVEAAAEEKSPEPKEEKPAEQASEADGAIEDDPEAPLDEAEAIAAQEALLSDTAKPEKKPKKKDATPLEEREEWRKARAREKTRIEALERENAELRKGTTVAAPAPAQAAIAESHAAQTAIPTPADVEAQIAKLDQDWNEGKFPDMDFSALEAEKVTMRAEARVLARLSADRKAESERAATERVQREQATVKEKIDKAIAKAETVLPGLKTAFIGLASDPVLKNDPIIGQAIMQNLESGGLSVAYYLYHHKEYAIGLLDLPLDERFAKLYELRQKLTNPKKAAAKPADFKPSKPIVNSHIPDKGAKEKETEGVEAELKKARDKRMRR